MVRRPGSVVGGGSHVVVAPSRRGMSGGSAATGATPRIFARIVCAVRGACRAEIRGVGVRYAHPSCPGVRAS